MENISFLEVLGAFALFFIIVLAALTQCGWAKWSVEIIDDKKAK